MIDDPDNPDPYQGLNDSMTHPALQAVLDAVEVGLQRDMQALHAGLSRRDWHATETAANQLRDRLQRAQAGMRAAEWRVKNALDRPAPSPAQPAATAPDEGGDHA